MDLTFLIQSASAFPSLVILLIIIGAFIYLQGSSFKQIKEIQENNHKQTTAITKSTIETTQAVTILAASTMGKEIVSGITPNLISQQAEINKLNDSVVELKKEVKDRYDKSHDFNNGEFKRLFGEIKITEGKIDLLLANSVPNKSLNVDLKVSEK